MNNTTDLRAERLQVWLRNYYQIEENSFTTVSGDASFRRYFRFIAKQAHGFEHIPLIAVDAPPEHENSRPFIDIAQLLLKNNLPVPKIYEHSLDEGFYIQQDFGDQLLLSSLNNSSVDYLYELAMSYLSKMFLVKTNTLPPYNSELLQREMHLFSDWFVTKHKNLQIDPALKNTLEQTYSFLEGNALNQPQGFVHRDYHSRNIMVLSYQQLGIIDFQDAVKGPVTYDLVSLLRDCYIDWPETKTNDWVNQYMNLLPEQYDPSEFMHWFDLMGIQRHLKAIGIFSRLNYRDNKPGYLNDIPRTLNYVINVSAKYNELKDFNAFVKTLL